MEISYQFHSYPIKGRGVSLMFFSRTLQRLMRRLLAQGHEVVCVDNLSTGFVSNIEELLENPNFRFMEADITDPFHIPFDAAFNLACPASPPHYQRLSLETIDACTVGVRNLLRATLRNGGRLVHASTSEVYGDPEVHPQRERYHGNVGTLTERACYDVRCHDIVD